MREIRTSGLTSGDWKTEPRSELRHRQCAKAAGEQPLPRDLQPLRQVVDLYSHCPRSCRRSIPRSRAAALYRCASRL